MCQKNLLFMQEKSISGNIYWGAKNAGAYSRNMIKAVSIIMKKEGLLEFIEIKDVVVILLYGISAVSVKNAKNFSLLCK